MILPRIGLMWMHTNQYSCLYIPVYLLYLCNSLANSRKKTKWVEGILFWKPLKSLFYILYLLLERPVGIPHHFFLVTPGKSTLFLSSPRKLHLLFLFNNPGNSIFLTPLSLFFFFFSGVAHCGISSLYVVIQWQHKVC